MNFFTFKPCLLLNKHIGEFIYIPLVLYSVVIHQKWPICLRSNQLRINYTKTIYRNSSLIYLIVLLMLFVKEDLKCCPLRFSCSNETKTHPQTQPSSIRKMQSGSPTRAPKSHVPSGKIRHAIGASATMHFQQNKIRCESTMYLHSDYDMWHDLDR